MKKRVLTLLLVACSVFLCACGGGTSTGNNDNTENVGNTGNTNTGNETAKDKSYIFTCDGIEISVNDDIEVVIDKLGEPLAYFEAASCAFEGLDKFYTYSSFQLDTYPKNGKDMLASIYFKDDLVKTTEGISLYMTKADMIAAYGEATSVNGTEYIYEKGNGCLKFIIEDDEIVSIEYKTKVEYN